jgi:crossover junction endodeoxyribonuclease RuvC
MTLILGIDPGSLKTGFGVIRVNGNKLEYVASGCIRLPAAEGLPARLKIIFNNLSEIIEQYKPDEVSIEEVFMHKSAGSALKLGQARGGAIAAAVAKDLPVFEYSAKAIKKSVVGNGGADKVQVQHMVRVILGLSATPQEDAADALAGAMCHANTQKNMLKMAGATKMSRGRLR